METDKLKFMRIKKEDRQSIKAMAARRGISMDEMIEDLVKAWKKINKEK